MTSTYAILAAALIGLAVLGLFTAGNMLRRILALNVMSSAVFLLLVVIAQSTGEIDPVPHAMVLTGIVVSVSTTAVALTLILRAVEARRHKSSERPS